MNTLTRWSRTLGAATLVVALSAATVVVTAAPADAAVVRPFTLNYNGEVYGDYILTGNGNSVCPIASSPADPFGEPIANCAGAQARTNTSSSAINDSYYMRWADVDSSAATYNSSQSTITIPAGARVAYARLNWSGDTGTVRLADSTVSALPGCNTRQFLAGGGTAVLPAGTPESTSVRFSVDGTTAAHAPQVISRDALANVPASQPQFYTAYANVTSRFSGLATGAPITLTTGNVWSPQGFGCYSGWSLTVVYAYDTPNADAPTKKQIFLYDGHVRQSSTDAATTVTVSGFRAAAIGTRVGVTAFEGDSAIVGDQFSVDGTVRSEPSTFETTNFFNSSTDSSTNPVVPNNMSVDAKSFVVPVAAGATSATATFATSGDTYLASGLVVSVPTAALAVTTTAPAGPYIEGDPVTYTVTVTSPGFAAAGVSTSNGIADCARSLGDLSADETVTFTCAGTAASDDYTVTTTATATGVSGASAPLAVDVIHPAVEITKTADKASYTTGDTIIFTIAVENTGDVALAGVTVTDAKVASCAATIATLAVAGVTSYTCTTTAPVSGDANTASVTASYATGRTVTDSSTVAAPTLGTVAGRVFADRDDDGVVDTGEAGISGVSIALTGTTTAGAPVTASTVTGATGGYRFTGIAAGIYEVSETQPAAFDDGIDTPGTNSAAAGNDAFAVTLASGQNSSGSLFAELATSGLAGSVFVDLDGDGARDAGEAGLADVAVTLSGVDSDGNAVEFGTTTAAGGAYSFTGLRAGTYAVTETQPAGYGDGSAAAGTAGGTVASANSVAAIALPARTNTTGYAFGDTVGSLTGAVYVDDDGDGVRDVGEAGIAGVMVRLTGTDTAGAITPATTTTSSTGDYAFSGLLAGTYAITETQPAPYGNGIVSVGSAGGTSGTNTVTGIALAAGGSGSGYLFGETAAALSGAVFVDADADGVRDAGEAGLAGVTVTLTGTDANGDIAPATATTSSTGEYTFAGLLRGTYTITETQPAGYGAGTAVAGTSGGTTSANASTRISLVAGTAATGYLFGETTGSLAGAVFHDADGDGTRDAGEPGIVDVAVALSGTDALGAAVTTTTTTDSDGGYSFSGLLAGTYTLSETQPDSYGDGPVVAGTAGGTVSAGAVSEIELSGGEDATGYLFAETSGSLSGAVYSDLDGDGVRDAGEPGIAGVTVTLGGDDATGTIAPVDVVTDGDGDFSFSGLLAGAYIVSETLPAGYGPAGATAGTEGGTTGPDSVSGILLTAGASGSGYLFGHTTAGIAGVVFSDVDGDGSQGADEPGIPGVTATLTGTDVDGAIAPVVASTDSSGAYAFTGLLAGTYAVTETQPTGYADGAETIGSAGGTFEGPDSIVGIELEGGESATGYLFAEERGSITGRVWLDADGDGIDDVLDETGVDSVSVTLYGVDDGAVATASTDADGAYSFGGLTAGAYRVGVAPGAGRVLTVPVQGDASTGSDIDWVTGLSDELLIDLDGRGGTHLTDIDAGIADRVDDLAVELATTDPSARAARAAAAPSVTVGDPVRYYATVSNRGNSPVDGAILTVTFPASLRLATATGDGWTCATVGLVATCETPELVLPGGTLPTVTLAGAAVSAGGGSVAASVAFRDGTVDSVQDDNATAAALVVVAAEVEPTPDPDPTETPDPTDTPTPDPSESPTPEPTQSPIPSQSPTPTAAPTAVPVPTTAPTAPPTAVPGPVTDPTVAPTASPTIAPTVPAAGTPTPTPAAAAPGATPAAPTTPTATGGLAFTGAEVAPIVAIALLLILGGVFALTIRRRRRVRG